MRFKPLDPAFPMQKQLGVAVDGPVVLVNVITLDAPDEEAFLVAWAADAALMKARPGFISTQLHRAVGPSPTFLNHAVWETLDAFRTAFDDAGFQAQLADHPDSVVISPHLFQRVAVPDICVA